MKFAFFLYFYLYELVGKIRFYSFSNYGRVKGVIEKKRNKKQKGTMRYVRISNKWQTNCCNEYKMNSNEYDEVHDCMQSNDILYSRFCENAMPLDTLQK